MATSIYAKPIKAKTILKFTLPTVLMMVFMSLYTVVDGIVVANCVGSDALSAINIVYPFTLVFMAVGLMFSTGSNAIIAKKMGEGKQEEANRLMSGVAITATVISIIIAVLFTIFAEPMYMMFGSNEKILPYCIDYGSVMTVRLCNVLADAQPIVPCNSRQATYHACFLDTVGLHKHCA